MVVCPEEVLPLDVEVDVVLPVLVPEVVVVLGVPDALVDEVVLPVLVRTLVVDVGPG